MDGRQWCEPDNCDYVFKLERKVEELLEKIDELEDQLYIAKGED